MIATLTDKTIRQQWADLRRTYKANTAQDTIKLRLRWPDIDLRHPPASEKNGWWQPGLLQARTVGANRWRDL